MTLINKFLLYLTLFPILHLRYFSHSISMEKRTTNQVLIEIIYVFAH